MPDIRTCQRADCGSYRILTIGARAKDMHWYEIHGDTADECYGAIFSPDGDTTEITLCLHCGQIQDKFPHPPMFMEQDGGHDYDEEGE